MNASQNLARLGPSSWDKKSWVFRKLKRDGPHYSKNANVSKSASRCSTVEEINTVCGYFPRVEISSIPLRLIMAL